jgi:MerR family copper efflux transcriptional regulator
VFRPFTNPNLDLYKSITLDRVIFSNAACHYSVMPVTIILSARCIPLDIPVTGRCKVHVMDHYSIGEVAEKTGLPAKTIRFYEQEGIITSATRSENGYRTYSESALEEIKMLKTARDMGLPLSEIKKLTRGCENGDCRHSKEYIDKSISDYLEILTAKINQMTLLKTKLQDLKLGKNGPYCCNLLHQLKGGDTQ